MHWDGTVLSMPAWDPGAACHWTGAAVADVAGELGTRQRDWRERERERERGRERRGGEIIIRF